MSPKEAFLLQPDIKRYFYIQRHTFAVIGMNPLSLECTVISYLRLWFPMIVQLSIYIPIIYNVIENIQDVNKVTTSLSPIWQAIITTFKIFYFIWNRQKIIALIRKLWLWNLEAKGEEHAILTAENRKDIIFCTYFYRVLNTTGVAALLAPIFVAGINALQGKAFWDYLEEPVKATYVIDKQSVFGYIAVYISNMIGIHYVIFATAAFDSLFSWFMCNIVAQLRILKHRLHVAGGENNGNCSTKTIAECIAFHCRTIELANEFNDAFRVVIFIMFALSCTQICCLAFQFSRGDEIFDRVYHGLFLLCVSMQLMLYCYGGQRIQNESESIANEIYECFHWESLSLSNRKMLIFSMMRSQVPCNVSGIFFTANLSLYLWVYRTAASLIALLKTLEEENEGEGLQ